jgi:hypothetical protein
MTDAFRLGSPNPPLQRTRFALLRSPLSRQPLGEQAGAEE